MQLVTKQEKLVLKFLLAALTLGVLATVYKKYIVGTWTHTKRGGAGSGI